MGRKQSNKWIIILLIIVIIILGGLCVVLATSYNNLKNNEIICKPNGIIDENNDNYTTDVEDNISIENLSEENLKNIIEDQLFILFRATNQITKKEDIDNNSKLLLALNILENNYLTSSNAVSTTFIGFSKTELEKAFNSSVISDLRIKHENFDIYELTEDYYNRNNSLLVYSKEIYNYITPGAKRVKKFEKNGNKYIISMNYLFADDNEGFNYYYGSSNNKFDEKYKVVKAYDDNGNYINAQEYLDNNYETIKDKLATYNYTFEIKNNKLILTNYSIK